MEFNSLPLIYITCKIKGLVKINQNPTGETGTTPVVTPYSSKSGFLLSYEPLENISNKFYLPFTRKIDLSSDEIEFCDDGLIKHCKWPKDTYSFELFPPYIEYANSSFANVICEHSFYVSGIAHSAFVYEEMSYYIGIENSNTKRLVFACNIDFMVSSASITLFKSNDIPYLIIQGKTKQDDDYIVVLAIKPKFKVLFSKSCLDINFSSSRISTTEQIAFYDIKVKREYMIDQNSVEKSQNYMDIDASSQKNIIVSFLEMIRIKSEKCLDLISKSLKAETCFSDIVEYFGDFTEYETPISSITTKQNHIALKYNLSSNRQVARVFAFDFKKQGVSYIIDNIYEP